MCCMHGCSETVWGAIHTTNSSALWQHVAIIGVEFCDSIGIAYVVIVKVTRDLNQV